MTGRWHGKTPMMRSKYYILPEIYDEDYDPRLLKQPPRVMPSYSPPEPLHYRPVAPFYIFLELRKKEAGLPYDHRLTDSVQLSRLSQVTSDRKQI